MRRAFLGALAAATASLLCVLSVERAQPRLHEIFLVHDMAVSFAAPEWLYGIACVPWLAFALLFSLANLGLIQAVFSFFTRAALFTLLILALMRPHRTTETTRASIVAVVDVSDSMTDEALVAAEQNINELAAHRGDATLRVVAFANHAERIEADRDGRYHVARLAPSADDTHPGSQTDLRAALQLAYGLFDEGTLRRMAVFSDGLETLGTARAEAERAKALGIRIFTVEPPESHPQEVAVRNIVLPEHILVGEPFHVRANIFSTYDTKISARLYQNELLNGLDSVRDLDLHAGDNELDMLSVVRVPGPVAYTVRVTPTGPDRFRENNTFTLGVVVPGKPTVLVVDPDVDHASYLARALTEGQFDVEVRTAREIPTSLREFERFDFFLMSDVSAEDVSLSEQELIERYVRDLGGGFMMAGGDRSFGLGGWQHTALEDLLPVRMDSERRHDEASLAIALVIDKSGSMQGTKIELAKDAAKATAEILGADDYIEIIGFDNQPNRSVRMQSASNRLRILSDIGRLAAGGGTAIFPALDAAYQDLSVTRARVKHVILLTDGQTNESNIETLVSGMRAEGMTVTTVGLGADVNRALLESIANIGGGRSYFTNDPHNVPRIFVRETTTMQRASAVEEYVQPSVVARADFMRGLDLARMPYLHGYVATQMKPVPAQELLVSDLGEPLLARWHVGLGWSLAWTSDIKNRWAVEWLKWPLFQQFWAQLVREHMKQVHKHVLPMRAVAEGDEVHVEVDALDGEDHFLNGLESTLRVDGPMPAPGSEHTEAPLHLEVPLVQTAPGRYEARVPLARYGAFALHAIHRKDGHSIAESDARVALPYPSEYARFQSDKNLLNALTERTTGLHTADAAALRDPRGETVKHREALFPWLVGSAIGLMLIDLLLRRVRIFSFARRV